MSIINNNVENVKFLRNQNPFESREVARQALVDNKGIAADGTALLARYSTVESGATVIKTIVGYVAEYNSIKYLTVIDVEGASADVEKLREEINAKLGTTFISSSNTVEANLTALSGGTFVPGTSSSANTSVEGAKAYAYDLLGTLDYEDSAVEGQYVSQVTQADGKIAVTRVELPTVAGEVESKKVVMSVSEDKGKITVNKGTIESSDKTVVINDLTEGDGIDFKVNIDGQTLVADTSTGVISVASAALTQYVGDEDTIHISAADAQNNKTVSSLLSIKEVSTSVPDTVAHRYMLAGTGTTKIGEYIDIPKDSALVDFYLGHVDDLLESTTAQTEESTSSTVVPGTGDTALVWIMQLSNGKYKLTAVDVHSFIDEAEFASGVTWDSTAKRVKGVVDPASEKDSSDNSFLTVGTDGFKISGIKAEVDTKINALDATVGSTTVESGKHVAVQVVEDAGKLVSVTVTEDDIASADDIEELSAKTITDVKSANGSVTVTPGNAADGTKEIDLATDASKIKMSGFSSTDIFSGITPSSSVTEAFKEVEKIIADNEQVTAEALIDLDERLDVVEGEYISGVSVNGISVTPANKVAPISIIAATSAATGKTAIVVDTDNSGNITLGISSIDCGYYA